MSLTAKPLLIMLTFGLFLSACQQGFTSKEVEDLAALKAETKQIELETQLLTIRAAESSLKSELSGTNIPSAFQGISIPEQSYLKLDFSTNTPGSLTYVDFVRTLNINCDGTITYSSTIGEYITTLEQLIYVGRWSTDELYICGALEVPEGKKLTILSNKSTQLANLKIETKKNSLIALLVTNTTYSGDTPDLKTTPESVLKLIFK